MGSRQNFTSNKGFSFLEMMMMVGLASIIALMGFSRYSLYSKRQQLRTSAQDMVTKLRLIQKRVNAGERGLCGAGIAIPEYIVYRHTGTKYYFAAYCPDISSLSTIEEYQLINGVSLGNSLRLSVSPPPPDTTLRMLPLNQGISQVPTIRLNLDNCAIPVNVTLGGTITVGDVTGC